MRKQALFIVVVVALLTTLALGVGSVSAANTKISLTNLALTQPAPGFVNANQNAAGDLRIVAAVKHAQPNQTYGVWLLSNPAHFGGAVFSLGTITTDDDGNANSGAIWIPVAQLQSSLLPGAYTGHVDILGPGGFTADMVPFTVP